MVDLFDQRGREEEVLAGDSNLQTYPPASETAGLLQDRHSIRVRNSEIYRTAEGGQFSKSVVSK
jgi:hypothetical protein